MEVYVNKHLFSSYYCLLLTACNSVQEQRVKLCFFYPKLQIPDEFSVLLSLTHLQETLNIANYVSENFIRPQFIKGY